MLMRNHLFLSFLCSNLLFVPFLSIFEFLSNIFFLSHPLISSILLCSLHFISSHIFSSAPFISFSLLLPCCPRGPLIVFLVLHCERLQSPANKQIQIGHMIINRYAVKFNDGQIRRQMYRQINEESKRERERVREIETK